MTVIKSDHKFTNSKGFIVIEGVNGAGKSTLLNKILQYKNIKERSITTREPGGTNFGKKMREILLSQTDSKLNPNTEVFLFAADRCEHVNTLIKPALDNKKLVFSDRYLYSTIAFQGFGRGLDIKELIEINNIATSSLKPDLVILLDLDPEVGLRRTHKANREEGDSFELEDLSFHNRLRDGFLDIAKNFDEPFFVVDASKSQEEMWESTKKVIDTWLSSL